MPREGYRPIGSSVGTSIGTFFLDAFLPWLVGEIVPFGDLVTNVWLWSILPTTRPAEYVCSDDTYTYMRNLLLGGTIVSAIPEGALIFGIIVGVTGVVVGGLAFVAHRQDGDHILGMTKDLARYSRYICADGKATADFLVHRTRFGSGDWSPMGWKHTVEIVVTGTMMVAHAPLLLLVRCGCCWFAKKEERVFVMFVTVQVLAGVATSVASLFFWIVSGQGIALTSAAFGMYSLLVGTVIAAKKSSMDNSRGGAVLVS